MDKMKQFYLLQVVDNLYPVIHGPYSSPETRDEMAKTLRKADPDKENGLFKLTVTVITCGPDNIPATGAKVETYSGGFFDE
jgi:hypothetical protein